MISFMHMLTTLGITMEGLFGEYCSGDKFFFDQSFDQPREIDDEDSVNEDTQATTGSTDMSDAMDEGNGEASGGFLDVDGRHGQPDTQPDANGLMSDPATVYIQNSQDSELSQQAIDARLSAFRAALGNATWNVGHEIGLLSTRDHHTELEQDLGESPMEY